LSGFIGGAQRPCDSGFTCLSISSSKFSVLDESVQRAVEIEQDEIEQDVHERDPLGRRSEPPSANGVTALRERPPPCVSEALER
jgi:hypothetical protein